MQKHKLVIGVVLGMILSLLVAGGLFLGVVPSRAQGPTPNPTATPTTGKLKRAVAQALLKNAAKGEITGINGTTLTVASPKGNLTVNTDAQTKFRSAGQAITLKDLKVGDQVAVVGKNNNGTIAARAVVVIPPHAGGIVKAIDGGTLTVSRDYLTGTIVTTSSTAYMRGKDKVTLADIKVGDQISATGTANSDGSLTATRINVIPPTTGGKVTAVSGNKITVTRNNLFGTIITSNATVVTRGGQPAKLSDITVGSTIAVQGTPNSDGTFSATRIVIRATP